MKIAILCASDRCSKGECEDKSGVLIKEIMSDTAQTVEYVIVPDDEKEIANTLIRFCDELKVDVVLTTGGTGLAPRDVTPEATKSVIEREVPGIPQAIREYSLKITDRAMLSRAVSGIRKSTLIINLPGSPKAVRESLEIVKPAFGKYRNLRRKLWQIRRMFKATTFPTNRLLS